MIYRYIDFRTDKEVGEIFPQIQILKGAAGFNYGMLPEKASLLSELHEKAKITDILSEASLQCDCLVINKKVLDLFSNFSIMKNKIYKCDVIKKIERINMNTL